MPTTPFLGEIMLVPYNFAPRSWAFCQGQILPIAQNSALFSLLGTTYGGNGQTTFALPDLRGRCAVSQGQGPGLSNYALGQVSGNENVTLSINQMPAHGHSVGSVDDDSTKITPTGNSLANISAKGYSNAAPTSLMNQAMIKPTGNNQPFQIIQPLLALNYCIALEGVFPSRN
jgi:microcystin-dependent protein